MRPITEFRIILKKSGSDVYLVLSQHFPTFICFFLFVSYSMLPSIAKNEPFVNNRLKRMKGVVTANFRYYCEIRQKGHRETMKDVSDPIL